MSIVGVKRAREDEEFDHNKKFKADLGLSVFQLPELVENILKYCLKNTKLILTLSALSKMHYELIHTTAVWVQLGFSPKISRDHKLSEETLKFILAQMRITSATQKLHRLQEEIQDLEIICSDLPDLEVDLEPEERLQFVANNYLTEKTVIALLRIIERTIVRTFSLTDLVQWLERDPQPSNTTILRCATLAEIFHLPHYNWLSATVSRFNNYTTSRKRMQDIFLVRRDREEINYLVHVKRVILKTDKKTLLLISSSLYMGLDINDSLAFIKFDRSTKTIECCGDFNLYTAKNFDGDHVCALKHLAEDDELPDDPLNFVEEHASSPDNDEVAQNYSKYVAENIPFVLLS